MSPFFRAITCVFVMFLCRAAESASEAIFPEAAADSVQEIREDQIMESSLVMDFDDESEPWRTINDGVMGGVSSSSFVVKNGVARFEGTVSLENDGGFASVRSRPRDYDLSPFQGMLLRVRGDGKRYAFRMRTTSAFDGISYEAGFKTVAGQWITVPIPFEAFQPVFRGRLVRDAEPLNLESVKTFGFLISDKQAGKFCLEVDWVKAYTADAEE
jgi:NADH dehydrogenase [ubiquinone] 1 alpha subcomplex assembly factor 1